MAAEALAAQQATVAERLADWSASDVAVFADLLARYNEADVRSA